MKNHILLEKAKKYDIPKQNLTPRGCSYKAKDGYWVETSSNIAMMKSDNPQKPVTKKFDIETGEPLSSGIPSICKYMRRAPEPCRFGQS